MTKEDFNQCVERYADDVYGFCTYLAGNTSDRDELFQDTFLLATRQRERIDREGNVKSYFLSLAVGIHRNSQRKRRLRQLLTGERSMDEEDCPQIMDERVKVEEAFLQQEEASFLRSLVRDLPEKYKIPIILFYMEGLSQEETARCMRLPVGTVKSRLSTARKKLKERMEAAGYDR
jgi:RNA polymerase sigma-70 factor (ECF subfamily)